MVHQPAGKFCFLSERVRFWRKTGSRLIQSVGEITLDLDLTKTIKERLGDLFSSLVGVRVVLNEGQM